MNLSPLFYHEVITPRLTVTAACAQFKHNYNLYLGMLCQKEHEAIFRDKGLAIETFDDLAPIDRVYLDTFQDDKLSLWQYESMKPGETHTIGYSEKPVWDDHINNGHEVYIHSFEQYDPKLPLNFRFCGTYAYSKLLKDKSIIKGTRKKNAEAPDTWFFRRNVGYNRIIK